MFFVSQRLYKHTILRSQILSAISYVCHVWIRYNEGLLYSPGAVMLHHNLRNEFIEPKQTRFLTIYSLHKQTKILDEFQFSLNAHTELLNGLPHGTMSVARLLFVHLPRVNNDH
jgi:hypothetical protein